MLVPKGAVVKREEKVRRIKQKDGKVFEISKVEIDPTYLNSHYRVSQQTFHEINEMGLLKVFELTPLVAGPSFTARWDGGSRDAGKTERSELDFDIDGVSQEERNHFKNCRRGYFGHHTSRMPSDEGHTFQVSLSIPGERIFEGTVRFRILRKLGFEATVGF
jgi:hypothetical protein